MRQTSIHGMTNAGAFLLSITKIAQMCGGPLGMDDIMLASVKSAAFGGGVTLLLAILTMWRKGSLVRGQPASSHRPRSQRLQVPLARSKRQILCHPSQSWGL